MIQTHSTYNPLEEILKAIPHKEPTTVTIDTYKTLHIALAKGGWRCESPSEMNTCFLALHELGVLNVPDTGDILLIGNKYNGI